MTTDLDLTGPLPAGRLVIEASAGTGKTYSLSALVVRHVAERGLASSALLVVTFTRAAAAELRDRTRRTLIDALRAFEDGHPPVDQSWMSVLLDGDEAVRHERRKRIEHAIATFDDATITTIHGFCQQALRQLGMRSGTALDSELGDNSGLLIDEVCRDLVVSALVDTPGALNWSDKDVGPTKVLSRLTEAVTTLLGNPGAIAAPDPAHATPGKHDTFERLTRWVELVALAVSEVARRRRARQELGYDDLITGLRDAVCDPDDGPAVVAALNSRYQLVLVDEFQDTDPVQWQIFERAFTGELVTVGDPKQAIYRFRGADVHAYLAATAGADPVHLGTNYRSDTDLVTATNSLVSGIELGDHRIVATSVQAAPTAATRALAPGAPLIVRQLPTDPRLSNTKGMSAPLARRTIIADLVQTAVDLLDHHTLTVKGEPTPLDPGHIAVLVPSRTIANEVVQALGRSGIPAVRTRTGSVFDTPAVADWRILLAALVRPSSAPAVRAAALGVFLRREPEEIDPRRPEADKQIAALQQRCAQWAEQLANRPFLGWYEEMRSSSSVVQILLARPGGERQLTDVDHIAELLAGELGGGRTTAAAARRCLDRLAAAARSDNESEMRRIDSDAKAVQITTVHSSKGLEYPVVLLPCAWQATSSKGPLVYNDPEGVRIIDIATRQGWGGPDADSSEKGRKHHADVEQRGDLLRLLYVALTRAEHRTVVWWAPVKEAERSALNVVLFDRDEHGEPLGRRPGITFGPRGGPKYDLARVPCPDDTGAAERLEVLARRSSGHIEVAECPIDISPVVWAPPAGDHQPDLAVADPGDRVVADPAWRRWSFTAITNTLQQEWTPHVAPLVGGADESDEQAEGVGAVTAGGAAPGMAWADGAAGAAFGTLVHAVLERVDPMSATLAFDLRQAVGAQLRRDRLGVEPSVLVEGLLAALHTPLGPIADDRSLAGIPVADRLAELTFDLPFGAVHPRVTAADIGRVLLDTLPADDPQRPYAQTLANERFIVDLAGYLQGSIDAVLRVPDGNGHRFVVVDYKTNRLHERGAATPLDAYHPALLPDAMAHSDYPLQALLYSVALHRYLRWRLPAYAPERHLGGAAYLFLRGMVGPSTPRHEGCPYGVFAWRPPASVIEALDRLFTGGGRL